jgi:hypothetical protein
MSRTYEFTPTHSTFFDVKTASKNSEFPLEIEAGKYRYNNFQCYSFGQKVFHTGKENPVDHMMLLCSGSHSSSDNGGCMLSLTGGSNKRIAGGVTGNRQILFLYIDSTLQRGASQPFFVWINRQQPANVSLRSRRSRCTVSDTGSHSVSHSSFRLAGEHFGTYSCFARGFATTLPRDISKG